MTTAFFALLATTPLASAQAKAPAAPAAKPAAAVNLGPSPTASRTLGKNADTYIASMSDNLAIRARERDAFARYQVPRAPKAVVKQTPSTTTTAPEARVTLDQIVSNIVVKTVNFGEKSFLIGPNTIRVGQHINLNHGDKKIEVVVADVTSTAILFRDVTSNEVGTLNLNNTPGGMIKGGGNVPTAPGIQKAGDPATIDINTEQPGPPSRRPR